MISINMGVYKGLLLVALLVLGKRLLSEVAILFGLARSAETIGQSFASLAVSTLLMLLMWIAIQKSVKVSIATLIGRRPPLLQALAWIIHESASCEQI